MHNLKRALRSFQQPALAADAAGHICAANEVFNELHPAGVRDPNETWTTCLGGVGLSQWMAGISQGQCFRGSVGPLHALDRWTYHAAPVLDCSEGARWLVTLSRDDAVRLEDQSMRLSLHAAMQAGRFGLWDWDPQTDLSTWSPELYDLYRLPRGGGVEPGSRFLEMVHPEDRAKIDAAVGASPMTRGIDPYMFRMRMGDGSQRWIMTSARVAGAPQAPNARLIGVNLDVTEQVQAQAELEASRLEHARQQQIIRAVMEHAPVGIAVALHGEDRLAYVSRFGAEMVKLTPDQACSWGAWQFCHVDTQAPAGLQDLPLYRASRGAVLLNEEWLLRVNDASLVPVSCNAGPIHDAEGAVVGATLVWYDVTGFKAAQRDRELMLAAIAHELRTPLSAVQAWSEVLRRAPAPELLERGLATIARNVQAQARLVEDLVDIARMAAGKLLMHLVVEDFGAIVEHAIEAVAPGGSGGRIALHPDPAARQLEVLADEVRLVQALCNLLTNALKFTPDPGRVDVSIQSSEDFVELTVADHGIGIDPEHLEHVFDQFWQGRRYATTRSDGLGLGLHIARHIVHGHGGALSVHSDGLGQGTTFVVRLPLRRPG
ncbi:MAG: ATP-binding protein [Roseateles sp.]|uniref:ATP-binding protein n=1 Tax=Roseateles sp. TaxID=1971397 RepID=UPI00403511A0